MARQARKHSESGIYHAMLRGINQQLLFEEPQDYMYFLKILGECRQLSCFRLHAYCLMGNHVHLLIEPQEESLETIFKRIGNRYVYWYNVKYQRVGHLFQDRFRSAPVEEDGYFLTVLRYIHQNPVKAGLCNRPEDYPYSSWKEYLAESTITDTAFALGMVGRDELIRFTNEPNTDKCLEVTDTPRRAMTDDQALALIKKISHCQSIAAFQSTEDKVKIRVIQTVHRKGASIRQLSRLTGSSKGVIERWLKLRFVAGDRKTS